MSRYGPSDTEWFVGCGVIVGGLVLAGVLLSWGVRALFW